MHSVKKILWQSKSQLVSDSFHQHRLLNGANGGNAYDVQAMNVLAEKYALSVGDDAVLKKGESLLTYWNRVRKIKPAEDVIIMEPYPIVFGKRHPGKIYIGMIHHVDDHLGSSTIKHKWFFNRLKKRLRELDMVVTVSSYWKNYLESIGCNRVHVIYNSFDANEFSHTEDELKKFRRQYNLPENKPVLYIGNASRQKGVYDVYEALKNHDYYLVMTGATNQAADLPVHYLNLERKEYQLLLAAAAAVLCMSKMVEGWNRIAHEALLSRTPVIGSGSGGMKELLDGAGQLTSSPANLAEAVENTLRHKERFTQSGFEYASRFDLNYFSAEWNGLIQSVLK